MLIKVSYILPFLIMQSLFSNWGYVDARGSFKKMLCDYQIGLMGRNEYYEFVEPYIQEAEKTLKVLSYCKENFESLNVDGVADWYMSCLANYTYAFFHDYVRSRSRFFAFFLNASVQKKNIKNHFKEMTKNLLDVIERIKKQTHLKDLDTQEEFEKTTKLFQDLAKNYYDTLSTKRKLLYPLNDMIAHPM